MPVLVEEVCGLSEGHCTVASDEVILNVLKKSEQPHHFSKCILFPWIDDDWCMYLLLFMALRWCFHGDFNTAECWQKWIIINMIDKETRNITWTIHADEESFLLVLLFYMSLSMKLKPHIWLRLLHKAIKDKAGFLLGFSGCYYAFSLNIF